MKSEATDKDRLGKREVGSGGRVSGAAPCLGRCTRCPLNSNDTIIHRQRKSIENEPHRHPPKPPNPPTTSLSSHPPLPRNHLQLNTDIILEI